MYSPNAGTRLTLTGEVRPHITDPRLMSWCSVPKNGRESAYSKDNAGCKEDFAEYQTPKHLAERDAEMTAYQTENKRRLAEIREYCIEAQAKSEGSRAAASKWCEWSRTYGSPSRSRR